MLDAWMQQLLAWLSLPRFGLSSVFVVSFISATLLPLGSEPVVYGFVKLRPDLFWEAVLVATVGNTLGGIVDYWIGYGAERLLQKRLGLDEHGLPGPPVAPGEVCTVGGKPASKWHQRALRWLERYGAFGCTLSWLPGIGDPLCAVAGWLRLPFWPCVMWMSIAKLLRYITMTAGLVWMF